MTFHLIRFLTSAICQKLLQCLINVIFSIHEFDFGHHLENILFEMSIHATIYNKKESFRSAFKSKLTIEYRVSSDYCLNIWHCYKILPTWDSLHKKYTLTMYDHFLSDAHYRYLFSTFPNSLCQIYSASVHQTDIHGGLAGSDTHLVINISSL